MADEQLRMALIGTGHMGHNYIRMLQEHADGPICLSAAVARHEPARNWLCEHYPDIIIYNSADELYALGGSAFDATLVVTPQATHPAMVSQAFDHGKHVLCDKPAGMSVGHAAPMLKAASAHPDLAFGMIFQQRFYARHQRIKQILDSGALGTVKRVQLTDSQYFRTHFYHHTAPWRSSWHGEGGGVLIAQGPHLLDLWQWLFGMPSTISAVIPFGKYNDFAVDDEATLVMTYPNGMTGTFIISTGEAVPETRLDIRGSSGRLLMEGDLLRIWLFGQDTKIYHASAQCRDAGQLTMSYREERIGNPHSMDHYWALFEDFAQAALAPANTRHPLADGREGMLSLELADAAYLSAWQNQHITLPLDAEYFEAALRRHIDMER
ncbi:Gfo/Idh/MocA family protein [Bifidobacterium sp. UBA744]|uniref:Gfo/Idh/MocA family protein n=1 Tax=Bifidobacterium sp. UBA744 TaxID=1946112 RepID=UPI0025BA543B|nr:Gfo/Idh/MocA family oxidoreductase [Bifidobacterium sp. UBA744]